MVESFATKAPMKDGPLNSEPDNSGGMVESFATKAGLDRSASSVVPKAFGPSVESFATKAPLSNSPSKGYDSGTTMSNRSRKQSQ